MRQSAGDGIDGVNLDISLFYSTVPTIFGFTYKRGEPLAAMRSAAVSAVG